MDGAVLLVVVGLLTIVIGGGLGYGLATVKFLADLHAANREKQELQRQLSTAPTRNPAAPPPELPAAQPQPAAEPPAVSAAASSPPNAFDLAAKADSVPATSQLATSQLATSQLATSQPATSQPATSQPATSQPATSQPATSQPADEEIATWQRLIAETAARARSDALCIVDIDYLRQYRERYGKELGDYVASHVEQIIRDALQDLGAAVSRYEDQEFILAWPAELGTAANRLWAVRKTAAKVRADVEHAFLQIGTERLTVTISLGIALCEPGLSGEEVIARADEALAAAKKAGRNRGYYHSGKTCLPVEPLELPTEPANDVEQKKGHRARKSSGLRERRRHERKPCSNINLLAPCSDGVLPSMDKFQRVQFFDISSSGFSMLVPTVPTTSQFAVALINERGLIFMAAEVANIRQAKRVAVNDKPLLIVGCQFRQRLYPQGSRATNETLATV